MTTFSATLRTKRGKRSYREAAYAIGVPIRTYQNWEQGRNVPDALKQAVILKYLENK